MVSFSNLISLSKFAVKYILLVLFTCQSVFCQSKKDYVFTLSTKFGAINLVLFDKTPKHKANFLKLVNDKFYDSTLFHRVIQDFMIQGGDPTSKKATAGQMLGSGENGYKIPAEIRPDLFHKKGVISAARDGNPEKASSGCQFYIVKGKLWNDTDLNSFRPNGKPIPESQRAAYKTIGGTPHLDGGYTVFGEVISGLALVDSITNVAKGPRDRPLIDIPMKLTVKKMRKKKIFRKYGYQFVE